VFGRQNESKLLRLFRKVRAETAARGRKLLLAHHSGPVPTAILEYQPYLEWQTVFSRIRVDLAAETDTPGAE